MSSCSKNISSRKRMVINSRIANMRRFLSEEGYPSIKRYSRTKIDGHAVLVAHTVDGRCAAIAVRPSAI